MFYLSNRVSRQYMLRYKDSTLVVNYPIKDIIRNITWAKTASFSDILIISFIEEHSSQRLLKPLSLTIQFIR